MNITTSLFPQSGTGFVAKAPEPSVLSRYCARCSQHLDAHAGVWVTAEGSQRRCPTADEIPATPKQREYAPDYVATPPPATPCPFATEDDNYGNALDPSPARRGKATVPMPASFGAPAPLLHAPGVYPAEHGEKMVGDVVVTKVIRRVVAGPQPDHLYGAAPQTADALAGQAEPDAPPMWEGGLRRDYKVPGHMWGTALLPADE
jgi:hypothetical protein